MVVRFLFAPLLATSFAADNLNSLETPPQTSRELSRGPPALERRNVSPLRDLVSFQRDAEAHAHADRMALLFPERLEQERYIFTWSRVHTQRLLDTVEDVVFEDVFRAVMHLSDLELGTESDGLNPELPRPRGGVLNAFDRVAADTDKASFLARWGRWLLADLEALALNVERMTDTFSNRITNSNGRKIADELARRWIIISILQVLSSHEFEWWRRYEKLYLMNESSRTEDMVNLILFIAEEKVRLLQIFFNRLKLVMKTVDRAFNDPYKREWESIVESVSKLPGEKDNMTQELFEQTSLDELEAKREEIIYWFQSVVRPAVSTGFALKKGQEFLRWCKKRRQNRRVDWRHNFLHLPNQILDKIENFDV